MKYPIEKITSLLLIVFLGLTSCSMDGAIQAENTDTEMPSEDEDGEHEELPGDNNPGDEPGGEDNPGNEDSRVFVIGDLLGNTEYDDGLLLSDGMWECLDRKSGVAVFEFEDGAPQAVYFKEMPQARIVQGWETVVAVAKDAEGNVVGTFPGPQEEKVFSEYWELPIETESLYVQIYNVFVSDFSGEVYAASITTLF